MINHNFNYNFVDYFLFLRIFFFDTYLPERICVMVLPFAYPLTNRL